MTKPGLRISLLPILIFGPLVVTVAEPIDPRFPAEWHAQSETQAPPRKHWLPSRIAQLESEKEQLVNQIADLPLHEPIPLTSKLGYHSVQRDSGDVTPSGYHSLTADLVFNEELRSIGFVPAFDPMNPQRDTYAFPKRFKIEVLEGSSRLVNGVWLKDPDGTEWTEVVNWLGEDFPNPGPYPVVFSDIDRNVSKVRITVPKSDNKSDTEYFALGELYLFRSQEGEIADNMSVFGSTGISFEASDSFKGFP
jgi:hypothetical protein